MFSITVKNITAIGRSTSDIMWRKKLVLLYAVCNTCLTARYKCTTWVHALVTSVPC